jgi:hypothetical protein
MRASQTALQAKEQRKGGNDEVARHVQRMDGLSGATEMCNNTLSCETKPVGEARRSPVFNVVASVVHVVHVMRSTFGKPCGDVGCHE